RPGAQRWHFVAEAPGSAGCLPMLSHKVRRVILAIDQGTTGSTCIVFDEEGRPTGRAYREFGQHFPRPGWVEHDANEIWDVTRRVARVAAAHAGTTIGELAGLGSNNQRETLVPWDRETGEPVHHALVWQDGRTADLCRAMKEA